MDGPLAYFAKCTFKCGSSHLDRASNVEIGAEYRMIFIAVFF